jgi:FkbM family methyltransferase
MSSTSNSKDFPLLDKLMTLYCRSRWKGFSRLWQLLLSSGHKPYLLTSNKYGAKFFLNPFEYIDSHVIKSGYYESEVLETIIDCLDDNSIFWDVGANFGLHSVTTKFLKPKCQVVSIEPSPIMASQILANAKLNNIQLDLINVALSSSPKLQNLHLVDGNSGMTTLKPWEKYSYSNKIICWCEVADNLVRNNFLAQPTIIKVDVEGSELEVFMGMHHILSNNVLKVIIFEAGIDFLNEVSNPIHKLLHSFGFTFRALSRHENTSHNLDNFVATRI